MKLIWEIKNCHLNFKTKEIDALVDACDLGVLRGFEVTHAFGTLDTCASLFPQLQGIL